MTFPWHLLFSMTFQAWKMVFLNPVTFHDQGHPGVSKWAGSMEIGQVAREVWCTDHDIEAMCALPIQDHWSRDKHYSLECDRIYSNGVPSSMTSKMVQGDRFWCLTARNQLTPLGCSRQSCSVNAAQEHCWNFAHTAHHQKALRCTSHAGAGMCQTNVLRAV